MKPDPTSKPSYHSYTPFDPQDVMTQKPSREHHPKISHIMLAASASFYTQEQRKQLLSLTRRLEAYLASFEVTIAYESALRDALIAQEHDHPCAKASHGSLKTMGQSVDLLIALGGDGNLLRCARTMIGKGVKVLGVNLGNLGFLTALSSNHELEESLAEILEGEYHLTLRRAMLVDDGEGQVVRALNEVAFRSAKTIADWEIWSDQELVMRFPGDGLLVSTPTGSTAYSLSAGGPILHPEMGALVITPICPHLLTSRPIVLPASSHLRIGIASSSRSGGTWAYDGRHGGAIEPFGHAVSLAYAPMQDSTHLVYPKDHSFFQQCRDKLGWGGTSF